MSEEVDEDKCPPPPDINIKVEREEKRGNLTDQISGKGFSALFFREVDRGNQIADFNDLRKSNHYLTALKEAGIECDDLFEELFEIQSERNQINNRMEVLDPIIENYNIRVRQCIVNEGDCFGLKNLYMTEMVEWKSEINKKTMKLNLKILDRLSTSLVKVYGEDAKDLLKMLVEGEV